jgi:rhodanese-related sulfurtransferase
MMLRFAFTLFLVLNSCNSFTSDSIKYISTSDYILSLSEDAELIDVRTPNEFDSGHIQDAINIDFFSESFQFDILSLNKDSKIILYCRTNNRSSKSADLLKNNGFKDISVIMGGVSEWVKNGNDIVYPKSD